MQTKEQHPFALYVFLDKGKTVMKFVAFFNTNEEYDMLINKHDSFKVIQMQE